MRAYGYAVAVYFGMSANAPTSPNDCVRATRYLVVVVVIVVATLSQLPLGATAIIGLHPSASIFFLIYTFLIFLGEIDSPRES